MSKAKHSIAWLLAAGLVLSSQSAWAMVGAPKVKSSDQMVITVFDPDGKTPGGSMINDPDLHTIQIKAPQLQDLDGHWSQHSLQQLLKAGVLTRGELGVFKPNEQIKKNEFVSWVGRLLGKKETALETSEGVTRLEAAVWLADLLPAMNTGINGANLKYPFTDTAGISQEEQSSIHYLYQLGIMIGDGQGRFSPQSKLTRAEAAVLLDKVLSRANQLAKPAKYDVLKGTLPETVHTLVQENKSEAGVYTVVEDGVRYIVVAGGSMPNPGYSIEVTSLSESDGAVFVGTKVNAPTPGSINPEMIAYPVLVLKTAASTKPVFLLN